MRKKLVAGNWKMHGSLAENAALLEALKPALAGIEAVVCVPFPYLAQAQAALSGSSIAWGAQNVSEQPKGAFTGEVSASMLLDFGCKYVIVGHSERRSLYGESDELVAKKYMAAQAAGLTPILCVGESLEERESGVTEAVVARQLDAVIQAAGVASLAQSGGGLRARVGDRHRQDRKPGAGAGRACLHSRQDRRARCRRR
jgi:triosephosphate isomerase (TIM)